MLKRSTLKSIFFETSKCSGREIAKFVKFLMSIFRWQVNSSSNFESFFIVMTHNSSVNFKLILFLLWIKGSHQSPNFETFNCFDENLSYSSCHFPNYKSIYRRILLYSFRVMRHNSSVLLSKNFIYFKEPINVEIWWNFM